MLATVFDETKKAAFSHSLSSSFYWLLGVGVGVDGGAGYLTVHGVDCAIGFPSESVW